MTSRRKWFFRFLSRSIGQRKGRVAVAAASIMIASAVVVCALGISLGIRQKLGGELKAYGANMIVAPVEGYLNQRAIDALKSEPAVEGYSAQVYASVTVAATELELIGLEIDKVSREEGWKVTGAWPAAAGEVMLGKNAAETLGLKPGDELAVALAGREGRYRIAGLVERGGPEDAAILMAIASAQELVAVPGGISALLVRVRSEALPATVESIKSHLHGAEVKTLRQVAGAEEAFLTKMELLMGLVTVVIVISSSISVSSTMSATMLERLKEIGLMRAIGGVTSEIRMFFLAEAAAIGLLGGAVGFFVGAAGAEAVSKGAFHAYVNVPLYLAPLSVALGLMIAVLASLLPLSDALRRRPSVILRGE